jgi:retinol dehydrogenase-12
MLTLCSLGTHVLGGDEEFGAGMSAGVDMFEALSTANPRKTHMVWRYALSKLMVHRYFHGLIAMLAKLDEYTSVVVNAINTGWCGIELSRAKPHPLMEKVAFGIM